MRHVGDITKLNGANLPAVDVITGGSPCQDLSIAGARAGLAGERSGLFMEQIRVVKEMRDADKRAGRSGWNVRPRYMVWENVPGAFSSNGGKDFQAVLTEIARIAEPGAADVPLPDKGKWPKSGAVLGFGEDGSPFSICWRVHDAQFWGVPQRRKRIALVADFGGFSACEICFEREGMRGDPPQSGEERQRASAGAGAGASGAISFQERSGKPGGGKGILIQEEHTGALSTLNNQSVLSFDPNAANYAGEVFEDTATTVTANHPMGVYSFDQSADRYAGCVFKDVAKTLTPGTAPGHHDAIAYGISAYDSNAMKSSNPHSGVYEADTARTLDLNGGSPACNQGGMAVVQVLNDQGGAAMGVSEDVTASLRAQEHGHQPILYDVRITSDGTKNARAHCYPTETCRCLDQACDNPDSNHGGVAIVFGKTTRPKSKDDAPTYKELDVANTINTFDQGEARANELVVAIENRPQDSRVKISEDGIVQTLDARMGMGGGNVPMVMEPVCIGNGQVNQLGLSDKVGALNCMCEQQAVMTYGLDRASFNQGYDASFSFTVLEDAAPTQTSMGPGAVSTNIVRRLTPIECERLQGYPDNWTNLGAWTDSKGKLHKESSDASRYKALGNSIALPFWFYLLRRISAQYERPATLGSLFDGIGGFPLCWERCNGPGTALWASEIEEFPIAVTKYHFGGE